MVAGHTALQALADGGLLLGRRVLVTGATGVCRERRALAVTWARASRPGTWSSSLWADEG